MTYDVTDDASAAAAFGETLADGPVEVLVSNAGITGAGAPEGSDLETYRDVFETNVLGVVRCTQHVLPPMREAGRGRIVNISPSSAIISPPLRSADASTKFAVESISESLQAEVAPFGIRVIVVQAGTILTPSWGKSEVPPEDTAYPQAASRRRRRRGAGHRARPPRPGGRLGALPRWRGLPAAIPRTQRHRLLGLSPPAAARASVSS